MGQVLSRLVRAPLDWRFISQGFVNGASLYVALPLVLAALSKRRLDPATWRTACAAGAFVGGFRLVRQLIDAVAADDTVPLAATLRKYRGFVSGLLASALGLAVDDHFLGSLLVIWWSLRALRALLPAIPHTPTVIMCAAAAVLNPAAFLHKDEHQPAYQRFMEKMALSVKRDSLLGRPTPGKSMHGWNQLIFCDEIQRDLGGHPTGSCAHSVLLFVAPRVFLVSLKLYAPLYLAWSAFLLRVPNVHFVQNVARSAVFLTGYTVTQYMLVMWYQSTVSPNLSRLQHMSFAWLSGLWTLVERKERRPELAVYCAAHALNSLYLQAKKNGIIAGTSKWVSYPILALASGVLTQYDNQHAAFVRNVFGFDGP